MFDELLNEKFVLSLLLPKLLRLLAVVDRVDGIKVIDKVGHSQVFYGLTIKGLDPATGEVGFNFRENRVALERLD